MTNPKGILPGNVLGEFYVDETCIDCDLCRQVAPKSFMALGGYSIVFSQPITSQNTLDACKALVTCPTGSIGTQGKPDLLKARDAFPDLIDQNVYFCGYASRKSFGGSSYFIERPEGNILVDSPRFTRQLVRRIEDMGGVSIMFLTHRDDVAEHEKFRSHFECDRIIHQEESSGVLAERIVTGSEPVSVDKDLTIIPTPGHTKGHCTLLYGKFLFSGDHLAWSSKHRHLVAFREHNWYSWPETISSMVRLLDYTFEWVLPGHGRRAHYPANVMREKVAECVEWMTRVA